MAGNGVTPASALPETIRAWSFASRGAPSAVLGQSDSHPAPPWPPSAAYVKAASLKGSSRQQQQWLLVRVTHAALNPGDRFTLRMLPRWMRGADRQVPALDLAGVVLDVWSNPPLPTTTTAAATPAQDGAETVDGAAGGDAATTRPPFSKGDRVLSFLTVGFSYATGQGALQTHVVVPARLAVLDPLAPAAPDAASASGLLLAGSVAVALADAAVDAGALKPAARVLVNAAGGGIGTLAAQVARRVVGADGFVLGVCSVAARPVAEGLGVFDEVIMYDALPASSTTLSSYLATRFGGGDDDAAPQFDAVLDCVGSQALYVTCARYLRAGGPYVSVGSQNADWTYWALVATVWQTLRNAHWPLSPRLGGTGRAWRTVLVMDPGVAVLERLTGMMRGNDGTGAADDRPLRVVVDSEWAFDDALVAYERLERGHVHGKIIVRVAHEGGLI